MADHMPGGEALNDVATETDQPSEATWRPWPLRTPFLVGFVILCIALCCIIEVIIRGCSPNNCLVFGAPSITDTPLESNLLYSYLPKVLSVCFSLLWAVVQHDVMRLEAYFQMSKLDGALAEDSLLVGYSYMFPMLIPFTAFKRRHYVVLISSCTLLLINLIITPLTSGLFNNELVTKQMTSVGSLRALKPGPALFTSDFIYTVYDYQWENGSLPPFTTPTYALLPVDLGESVRDEGWVAETTLFEADMVCESAATTEVWNTTESGVGLKITSLSGGYSVQLCDYMVLFQGKTNGTRPGQGGPYECHEYTTFLTRWTSISYMVPSSPGSETYMYAWASGEGTEAGQNDGLVPSPPPKNITAIFCTPSYYSQPVSAVLTVPPGDIASINRTGTRTSYNATAGFGQVFSGDYFSLSQVPDEYYDSQDNLVGFGPKPIQMPNADSQLRRQFCPRQDNILIYWESLGRPGQSHSCIYMHSVYTLPAFALYKNSPHTLNGLLDPKILATTYTKEFQLLFAVAVSKELVDSATAERVTITRQALSRGFIVYRLWARGAQGWLGLVAVMVAVLSVINGRRACALDGEPNTLAAALQLLRSSPYLRHAISDAEFIVPEQLRKDLMDSDRKYQLVYTQEGPSIRVRDIDGNMLTVQAADHGVGVTGSALPDDKSRKPSLENSLWALKIEAVAVMLLALGLVVLVLVFVYGYARMRNGLPSFDGINSFASKVVYSYIPFAIGAVVEPVLVSVGSCYYMVWPYETLRRGKAKCSQSLAVDYDKSPPHFQLWRTLRAGQVVLTALTVSMLLAKLLAVALASIFSPITVQFITPIDVQTFRAPTIRGEFYDGAQRMYYSLAGSLSGENSPPTWTTQDYYVIPFYPTRKDTVQYKGSTIGIGLDITCNFVPADRISFPCNGSAECSFLDNDFNTPSMVISDPCFDMASSDLRRKGPSFDLGFWGFACPRAFFLTWIEHPGDPHPSNPDMPYKAEFDVVAMKCVAQEIVHEITAAVRNDQVVSTTDIRSLSSEEIELMYRASSSTYGLAWSFFSAVYYGFVTDTREISTLAWMNYLMATLTPSIVRHPTNVTHIPDTTDLVSTFEDLYRRLFAINTRLYADEIFFLEESYIEHTTATVQEMRTDVYTPMFATAVAILLYIVVVLSILFIWYRPQIAGHVPTTLAGTYALLYASNAMEYCGPGGTPRERSKGLGGENTYGYGKFTGADGRSHFGVFRESADGIAPAGPIVDDKNGAA